MKKQMVFAQLESLDIDQRIEFDLLISTLNEWKDKHSECTNLEIEAWRNSWSEDDFEIRLHGRRLETDEEFSKRVEYEEDASKRKEEADKRKLNEELQEYMRLKRKFEDDKRTIVNFNGE